MSPHRIHWATYCTASPLDRSTASRIQASWNGYLIFAALVPPGILLALYFAPAGFTVILVIVIVAFQLLSVAFLPARRSRLRTVWRALVSWLTYNRLGSFEALNVTPDGPYAPEVITEAIDFTKVFTHPEVHYFHLSSTLAPGRSTAATPIGRLRADPQDDRQRPSAR